MTILTPESYPLRDDFSLPSAPIHFRSGLGRRGNAASFLVQCPRAQRGKPANAADTGTADSHQRGTWDVSTAA